jgi:hypothetical protein
MKSAIILVAFLSACLAFDFKDVKPINEFWAARGMLPQSRSFNGRVVGGEVAAKHQFPHQVGLFVEVSGGTAFCGGSVIGK